MNVLGKCSWQREQHVQGPCGGNKLDVFTELANTIVVIKGLERRFNISSYQVLLGVID